MSKINPKGYYVVHRTMFFHWLWETRKLSKWEAWQWMIACANYEDKNWPMGNTVVLVKRGEFITSYGGLQKAWLWTNYEVRSFLKLLEKDQMIYLETNSSFTRVTISKYEDYQNISLTKHSKNNKKPPAVQAQIPLEPLQQKEVKEPKEIKKEVIIPTPEEFLTYCKTVLGEKYLPLEFAIKAKYDTFIANKWKDGYDKPIINWKNTIRNIIPHLKPIMGEKASNNGDNGVKTELF